MQGVEHGREEQSEQMFEEERSDEIFDENGSNAPAMTETIKKEEVEIIEEIEVGKNCQDKEQKKQQVRNEIIK